MTLILWAVCGAYVGGGSEHFRGGPAVSRTRRRSPDGGFVKTGVTDPPNVVQSEQGRYYVGRSGLLRVPGGHRALVVLRMPEAGTGRCFVVSITATSNLGRRAVYAYGVKTEIEMQRSSKLACAHRGAPDEPEASIAMATGPAVAVSAGIGVHERFLLGGDTLVLEQQGRLVLEPGEAIGVWFDAVEAGDEVDVAFGWWEEPAR